MLDRKNHFTEYQHQVLFYLFALDMAKSDFSVMKVTLRITNVLKTVSVVCQSICDTYNQYQLYLNLPLLISWFFETDNTYLILIHIVVQ